MSLITKIKNWFMRTKNKNECNSLRGKTFEEVLEPNAARLLARGLVRASRACGTWHELNKIEKCPVESYYYYDSIKDEYHSGPEVMLQSVLGKQVALSDCGLLLNTVCTNYASLIDNGLAHLAQKILRKRALELFKNANEVEKKQKEEQENKNQICIRTAVTN